MLRQLLTACLLLLTVLANGQQTEDWEQLYDNFYTQDEDDEDDREDEMERLRLLADHPLNVNQASREDLEQLPFLSDQQIEGLLEYRDRYGPLRSLGELRMVSALDYRQLKLLPFFLYIDNEPESKKEPSWRDVLRYGKHTLEAAVRVPFYERKGDRNGYLGYKYRHRLRYEFTSGQRLRVGFLAAQDAGEPFFAACNRWGYDLYSFYAQAKRLGRVEQLVAGRYRVTMGMGLVVGQSFSLGKSMTLQNMGRQSQPLHVHSSRSEADYFQGAGATVRLWRPFTLTAFASYRPVDATLNTDGTAATLLTTSYHRTPTEADKKHNTHLTSAGGSLAYKDNGITLAVNGVFTQLDRSLEPNRQTLYRRYDAHGRRFTNMSLSYGIQRARYAFNGETALDQNGHLATVNTLGLKPLSNLSIVALQRFYSYRYSSLHAHSFSDGGKVKNESGYYLGVQWQPLRYWSLSAYADYAYSAWARYLISQASHSVDLMLQADYERHRWKTSLRLRSRLRQRDDTTHKLLVDNNSHRLRLHTTYTSDGGFSVKTQLDAARTFYLQSHQGWMLSEHLGLPLGNWQLHLLAAYFHTDDYASRLYLYEHQLPGDYLSSSFYGEGYRLALNAQARLGKHWRTGARLGYTHYFDRSVIGSALQQIDASYQTDLDLYLRYQF